MANTITKTKDSKKPSPWALNIAKNDQEEDKTAKPAEDFLEGKPIKYDAPGRMIKPKDKPQENEQKSLVAIPPIPKEEPISQKTRQPSFDIQNAPKRFVPRQHMR